MRRRNYVAGGLAILVAIGVPSMTSAASPAPVASATASPCPRSLKFAGSLYLDTDVTIPAGQVGPQVGVTEPNPARCALPDQINVYRHNGRSSTEEVVVLIDPRTAAIFRSAGETGFPGAALVRWLVLALVLGIILFAVVPALLAHLRQPPLEVGRSDADWVDDA